MVGAGQSVTSGFSNTVYDQQSGASSDDFLTLMRRQNVLTIEPESATFLTGAYVNGALPGSLEHIDGNSYVGGGVFPPTIDGNLSIVFHFNVNFGEVGDPSEIHFDLTARHEDVNTVHKVFLKDVIAGQWVLIDQRTAGYGSNLSLRLVIPDDPMRFMDETHQLELKVTYYSSGTRAPKNAILDRLTISALPGYF